MKVTAAAQSFMDKLDREGDRYTIVDSADEIL